MRWIVLMGLLFLSGCISLDRRDQDDGYQQAVRKELAELVKSYRVCLQKYEDYPGKAKEHCGVYREALRDLAPPNDRRSIAEMLERLLEKGR